MNLVLQLKAVHMVRFDATTFKFTDSLITALGAVQ